MFVIILARLLSVVLMRLYNVTKVLSVSNLQVVRANRQSSSTARFADTALNVQLVNDPLQVKLRFGNIQYSNLRNVFCLPRRGTSRELLFVALC